MRVFVYLPSDESAKLELEKAVAVVHAEKVCAVIKAMHCPIEQKKALLKQDRNK